MLAPTVLVVGCALLWSSGFLGISNDDPSRALIAWDVAHAPSLDPTRSSWLPLHSLLLGALMALAGDPRTVPFAVSLGSALVAVGALARALRREGVGVSAVAIALSCTACWRWSLFSAAAGAVPEMPAVALLCVALERWCSRSRGAWWQAGLALTLAAGFRYEAWFAIAGFAFAARDRDRPRWEAPAALGLAMLVPIAWLLINRLHRGDALDFVHRVAAHRHEVSTQLAPWWSRWTEAPRALLMELPWIAAGLASFAGSRRRPMAVDLGAAMSLAVLAGLTFESARGGGATHHGARTLLPVAWLLAPSLAATLDELLERGFGRVVVVIALGCTAWSAPRPGETREMGARDASAVGAEAARRWSGRRWCLELQRQDALWVEWRSAGSRLVIPDRVFGGAPDDAARRAERCGDARGAVTSSWEFEEALRTRGFQRVMRRGAWAVMEQRE
ncbi:MAG: hypothetical protein KA978_31815 [Deltaproteobacteria bacterium]|nr:hypothetical protein [Deltaproteobacteria bacterium]MBP6835415.1 hypothetical protein [Deltaproteobacteria bacterium]